MVGLISPFPLQGNESTKFSPLAGYSKVLLNCLNRVDRQKILVISQREKNESFYVSNGLEIYRVWNYNKYSYFLEIVNFVKKKKIKTVHIQHEVFCFGGLFNAYLLILLEILLKLSGCKIIITIHGIIPKKLINKKFISEYNYQLSPFLIKVGLIFLYRGIVLFSDEIILHDKNVLKSYKEYGLSTSKVKVIPHPLYKFPEKINVPILLKKLKDKKIILYFGFLLKRKGIDHLIKSMRLFNLDKMGCVLVIAGSIPERLSHSQEHLEWINNLKVESAKISKSIIWENKFIPDNQIKSYFDSADVVVAPYTEGIASSGPVAFSVSNNTPILVSDIFTGIIDESLIYGSNDKDLAKALDRFYRDHSYRAEIELALRRQKNEWADEKIGSQLRKVYFEKKNSINIE